MESTDTLSARVKVSGARLWQFSWHKWRKKLHSLLWRCVTAFLIAIRSIMLKSKWNKILVKGLTFKQTQTLITFESRTILTSASSWESSRDLHQIHPHDSLHCPHLFVIFFEATTCFSFSIIFMVNLWFFNILVW